METGKEIFMNIPGVKVNRSEFLKNSLTYYSSQIIELAKEGNEDISGTMK